MFFHSVACEGASRRIEPVAKVGVVLYDRRIGSIFRALRAGALRFVVPTQTAAMQFVEAIWACGMAADGQRDVCQRRSAVPAFEVGHVVVFGELLPARVSGCCAAGGKSFAARRVPDGQWDCGARHRPQLCTDSLLGQSGSIERL